PLGIRPRHAQRRDPEHAGGGLRALRRRARGPPRGQPGLPVMRRRSGIVLVVVLFFALLLASTVATFARIALIDHMIVRNRDSRARADAPARGGVRLATALLLEDKLVDAAAAQPAPAAGGEPKPGATSTVKPKAAPAGLDYRDEMWARISGVPMTFEDGSVLRLDIEDVASKLNL